MARLTIQDSRGDSCELGSQVTASSDRIVVEESVLSVSGLCSRPVFHWPDECLTPPPANSQPARKSKKAGPMLENTAREARRSAGYEALFEIGSQIQAELKLDKVLGLIVQRARDLVGTEVAWLGLVDEADEQLHIRMTVGSRHPPFAAMHLPVGTGIGGVAVAQRRTVVVDEYATYPQDTPDSVYEAVTTEGIVSLICAPMLRGSKMVGALYVGNRYRTQFTTTDVSLLSTLATQASIAIENARLYREQEDALRRLQELNALLESKNRLLEQSFAIHQELTSAVLCGAGMEDIALTLARLIGKPIVVQQQVLAPFLAEYSPNSKRSTLLPAESNVASGGVWCSVPIIAGHEQLGRVSVKGARELSDIEQRAVEHGSTVLALELIKQRATRDVEWRLQGELLEALLEAHGPLPDTLKRRAQRMGFDVGQPHCVLVLQPDEESEDAHLGDLMMTARMAIGDRGPILGLQRGGRTILAIRARTDSEGSDVARVIQAAWCRQRRASVSVGVSGHTGEKRDFPTAGREALVCLQLARNLGGVGVVVCYDNLGPLRFLLDAQDLRCAPEFVRQQLGGLHAYDRTHRAELVPTVRAYLDAGGHLPTVARRCFIHISTLKYRLSRAMEILGAPLSDPELRFNLHLAFRLLDLLRAMDIDVFSPN